MVTEPLPLTRPLSDVGQLNKELRAGRLTLSAYMRQIGNDGGAGRRILVSWRGTARAWLEGEGR